MSEFFKTDNAHSSAMDESIFNRYSCESADDNAEASSVIEADLRQLADENNSSSQVDGEQFEKSDGINNIQLDNT